MLSLRIREAVANQKRKSEYTGGRPKKEIDIEKVKELYNQTKSLRKTSESYNQGKYKNNRISRWYVQKVISPVRKAPPEILVPSPIQGVNNFQCQQTRWFASFLRFRLGKTSEFS